MINFNVEKMFNDITDDLNLPTLQKKVENLSKNEHFEKIDELIRYVYKRVTEIDHHKQIEPEIYNYLESEYGYKKRHCFYSCKKCKFISELIYFEKLQRISIAESFENMSNNNYNIHRFWCSNCGLSFAFSSTDGVVIMEINTKK